MREAIEPKTLKDKKPKLGQILTTPYKNHNVFSLVVKERHYDPRDSMQLKRTLRELKIILLKKNLASFRVSRRGDLIDDMDPGLFTELLTEIFEGTRITVTVCYGKVELPSPEKKTYH